MISPKTYVCRKKTYGLNIRKLAQRGGCGVFKEGRGRRVVHESGELESMIG